MRASSPSARRAADKVQKPDHRQRPQAGSTLKAFTVYQPWATLIVLGAKPYEFRSWNPRERGAGYAVHIGRRHVIHAAARAVHPEEVLALIEGLEAGGEAAARTCLYADKALPILRAALKGELPLSAGVGTAVLGEPRSGLDVAHEFGVPRALDSDRLKHANFGWPMLEPEPWPEPVPMKGLQGFWGWPTPADVFGFEEDHSVGVGREGRSIHRSHRAEGRNWAGD